MRARFFPDSIRRADAVPSSCSRSGTADADGPHRAVPSAEPLRDQRAAAERFRITTIRMPPELRARTTSSARTSDARRKSAVRQSWTRDGQLRWLARGGLHVDRHPWHEPRLVSGDVHDRTRAAGAGRGAQSHFTVFRGRRLERAVHDPRAQSLDGYVSSIGCAGCGSRSSRLPFIERVRGRTSFWCTPCTT